MTNTEEYLKYVKGLPNIGKLEFCKILTSKKAQMAFGQLAINNIITIDGVVTVLSSLVPNILFFKGDRVIGNVEHRARENNPKRFTKKCNVQHFLWTMHNPSNKFREEIKGLENFFIFERVGNGKYKVIEQHKKVIFDVLKKRKDFVKRSNIDDEVSF